MSSTVNGEERVGLVRAAGVPVSEADVARITESVRTSLEALDMAVTGSLFDTEPQNLDTVVRNLATGGTP